MKIKPFAATGDNYTQLTNYMLDVIMPTLPANAWKLLCFIYRKTRGWQKQCDHLSYTQIAAGTGIQSSATISQAIKILLDKQYIIVTTSGKWDTVCYQINVALEIEAADTSIIEASDVSALEIEAIPALEIEATSLQKLKTQKKERNKENIHDVDVSFDTQASHTLDDETTVEQQSKSKRIRTSRTANTRRSKEPASPEQVRTVVAIGSQIDLKTGLAADILQVNKTAAHLWQHMHAADQPVEQFVADIRATGRWIRQTQHPYKDSEQRIPPAALIKFWEAAKQSRLARTARASPAQQPPSAPRTTPEETARLLRELRNAS